MWFINMWLNAHMHKRLQWDFFAQKFPREIAEDYVLGDKESATRPPLNFGEAIIVLPRTEANEDQIGPKDASPVGLALWRHPPGPEFDS
jgi:hypothetical protein